MTNSAQKLDPSPSPSSSTCKIPRGKNNASSKSKSRHINAEAIKKFGKKGFEFVKSPIDLTKKAKPLPPGRFDPIAAAERQTKQVSVGFKMWIKDDINALLAAFSVFSKDTYNEANFQLLNHAIHTIKGNAPILGAKAAGMIACPLSTMLESCSDHKRAKPIISLSINAICRAVEYNIPTNDQELLELVDQLELLNDNCQQSKNSAKATGQENVEKSQAAGSANCSSKSRCLSGTGCPDSCAKSSLSGKS